MGATVHVRPMAATPGLRRNHPVLIQRVDIICAEASNSATFLFSTAARVVWAQIATPGPSGQRTWLDFFAAQTPQSEHPPSACPHLWLRV